MPYKLNMSEVQHTAANQFAH